MGAVPVAQPLVVALELEDLMLGVQCPPVDLFRQPRLLLPAVVEVVSLSLVFLQVSVVGDSQFVDLELPVL